MKAKWINQNPKTLAVIFDSGDEIMAGLKKVAGEYNLSASNFTAIGALKEFRWVFLIWSKKIIKKFVFREQMEVL
jgi:predicted DNA-binding protein with PD1-like motif